MDEHDLMMALPVPVVVLSGSGHVAAQNARAAELIGVQAVGRHYITALRQPGLLDGVEAVLADRQTRVARYRTNDSAGASAWDVTICAAGNAQAVLSFQNVTAIEEAGERRRDFVANVSHELRTPLTAIAGMIETLSGPARDDTNARERFLAIMAQEAERMQALITDLLHLARVEDQERVRPTEAVALGDIITSVAQAMRPRAEARGVLIDASACNAECMIPGDAAQLRQVFNNLIENAIKYSAPDTVITLAIGVPSYQSNLRAQGVVIEVCDQGDGIAPHHVARLTERFFRVDNHRSREVGGTGLGLSIVKHIVNRHRGRLRIESTPGTGSRFTVTLPSEVQIARI